MKLKLFFLMLFTMGIFSCQNSMTSSTDSTLANGTYVFDVIHTEFMHNEVSGTKLNVTIKGDRIKVTYKEGATYDATPGDVWAEGYLLKHKSGKWIIAQSLSDANLEGEFGGCADGPTVIDLEERIYYAC